VFRNTVRMGNVLDKNVVAAGCCDIGGYMIMERAGGVQEWYELEKRYFHIPGNYFEIIGLKGHS